MYLRSVSSILLFVIAVGCVHEKERIPPLPDADKPARKMVVYQIMTRLFGNRETTNKTYGTRLENGVGKFNDINDRALSGLHELGITHVWYTGIIEHATQADYTAYGIQLDDADVVKGLAGSPYAIKDYYDVDPDLATDVPNRMQEFEQLIARTHANNLKVIIDFVPNHVARGYHSDSAPAGITDPGVKDDTTMSFNPQNNFYYLPGKPFEVPPLAANGFNNGDRRDGVFPEHPAKATGNNVFSASPSVGDWYETVKLNYGIDIQNGERKYFDPVPDTWNKMRDILIFWTGKEVDGFRCDMAEMVPVEFWNWVIPQVKMVNPDIVFIAEIYNPKAYTRYISEGYFDFLYDKVQLYDTLRMLTSGSGSTLFIPHIQKQLSDKDDQMLHFIENHDEQRAASAAFGGDMWKVLPAMTISAMIDRGPVMIYFGQESGEKGEGTEGFQGNDGRTTIFDYWGVPAHQAWMNGGLFDGALLTPEQKQLRLFYRDLLTIAGTNEAIVEGGYSDITEYNIQAENFGDQFHAFIRYSENEKLLIVTGFNRNEETIRVEIPTAVLSQAGLGSDSVHLLHDMLRKRTDFGLDENSGFELKMEPYSCFIFKIK